MSRHQRLRKTLRSPGRQRRQQRNRSHRLRQREFTEAMIALFRSDDRLTPPAWLWHATCGQQVIRPRDMVLLSGPY